MTDLRTAAQQALEAMLKSYTCPLLPDDCEEAITSLRAALAQQAEPVQEPVAWRVRGYNQFKTGEPRPWRYVDGTGKPAINTPDCCDFEPLYTAPPQQAEPVDTDCHTQGICQRSGYGIGKQTEPDAYGYASRLAVAIWEKHYKDTAPQWKPLDDLMGVLTQIDNMTSGLTRLAQQAEPVEPVAVFDEQQGQPVLLSGAPLLADEQPLYTAPPQRKPLTDEEILDAVGWERAEMYMKLTPNFPVDEAKKETLKNARAVERKVRGEEK